MRTDGSHIFRYCAFILMLLFCFDAAIFFDVALFFDAVPFFDVALFLRKGRIAESTLSENCAN